MSDSLDDRRRAMEEAFFAAQDRAVLERMREADTAKDPRAALRDASGITDEALLDRMSAAGLDAAGAASLTLVPLVAVAWADGELDAKERDAVLAAATEAGVVAGTPAHGLLTGWLAAKPPASLLETWEAYAHATAAGMDGPGRASLRSQVTGRARRVAESAGGFLGLTSKVSDAEAGVLRRLDAALAG